jgi:hypothetical protein
MTAGEAAEPFLSVLYASLLLVQLVRFFKDAAS